MLIILIIINTFEFTWNLLQRIKKFEKNINYININQIKDPTGKKIK